MTIEVVSALLLALLFGMLSIGVPMAFATAATGILLGLLLYGASTFSFVPFRMYNLMSNYVLVAVPLFIFMGHMLERGGVAQQLFRVIHIWSGPIRGGLAVGTIGAATILAALVGIIGAEIVTLGLVALPQMLARGYDRRIALGTICAGGSLGQLIPPSVVLILYALMANVPVGRVFAGAIIPGLMLALLYVTYVLIRSAMNPDLAPPPPEAERAMPLREKLKLSRELILPLGIAGAVLGSLYTGIATPTEAASVGVAGSLFATLVNGQLNWGNVAHAVKQTSVTIGMLMWIFFGANALISVYSRAGGVSYISDLITSLALDPIGVVLLIMVILFVLGMFIEVIGILVLTMPIFIPIIKDMGIDPIWFGIIFSLNMQISYLTPPFGPAVFFLKSVCPPEISLGDIFRSVWPFVGLQCLGLAAVIIFPELVLWLPAQMY